MTSNQIAYAQTLVNDRAEQEGERHNRAYEEETHRHNVATEELSKAANDIESERNYWERWYRQESNSIQRDYNNAYLALQTAQGKQKLDIEQQLANIKSREQFTDAHYKENMLRINDDANQIKRELADETVRSNIAKEALTQSQIANEVWSNQLKSKQLEYQNSYWNASISLGNLQAVYNRERDLNNYTLGLMNVNLGLENLKVNAATAESQKTLNYSTVWRNYLNGFTQSVRDIGSTINPYFGFQLFNNNVLGGTK